MKPARLRVSIERSMADADAELTPIRCIYCKELRPRPTRGEHVMLQALGGTITIQDVCGACNQAFGDGIDNEFVRQSPLAIMRLMLPSSRPHERAVFQVLPEHDVYVDSIAT